MKFTDTKDKNIKEKKSVIANTYLRLLLIAPAIALLGLTACSTADGTARHNYRGGYAVIPPRAYDPESRGYDTDHGPLVRNPFNNDQGEQIFAMSDVVAERIRKLGDVALRSIA